MRVTHCGQGWEGGGEEEGGEEGGRNERMEGGRGEGGEMKKGGKEEEGGKREEEVKEFVRPCCQVRHYTGIGLATIPLFKEFQYRQEHAHKNG